MPARGRVYSGTHRTRTPMQVRPAGAFRRIREHYGECCFRFGCRLRNRGATRLVALDSQTRLETNFQSWQSTKKRTIRVADCGKPLNVHTAMGAGGAPVSNCCEILSNFYFGSTPAKYYAACCLKICPLKSHQWIYFCWQQSTEGHQKIRYDENQSSCGTLPPQVRQWFQRLAVTLY